MDTLAMTLGGRAAEELVFDEVTTGAANDIEKVTASSKNMVMRWGMSEKLGPRALGGRHDQPFLGREFGHEADYSQEIAREIDDEIRRIIEEAHDSARQVLAAHVEDLHRLSKILLEVETIDRDQFLRLLDGEAEETRLPARRRADHARAGRRRRAPRGASRAVSDCPSRARPSTPAGRRLISHRAPHTAGTRSAHARSARPSGRLGRHTGSWKGHHPSLRTPSASGGTPGQRTERTCRTAPVPVRLQRHAGGLYRSSPGRDHVRRRLRASLPGVLARHGVSRPFVVIEEPVADHAGASARRSPPRPPAAGS